MSAHPEGLSEDMVGRTIDLSGVATDFKAGAGIVLDGGRSVLIEGKRWWEAELRGLRVTARGILRHEPPEAPAEMAEHVQHAPAGRWTLEGAEVRKAG